MRLQMRAMHQYKNFRELLQIPICQSLPLMTRLTHLEDPSDLREFRLLLAPSSWPLVYREIRFWRPKTREETKRQTANRQIDVMLEVRGSKGAHFGNIKFWREAILLT